MKAYEVSQLYYQVLFSLLSLHEIHPQSVPPPPPDEKSNDAHDVLPFKTCLDPFSDP